MNIGEFPEGMSLVRRDLIETLEMIGYDCFPGVAANWRDGLSDGRLMAEVARHAAEASPAQEAIHA